MKSPLLLERIFNPLVNDLLSKVGRMGMSPDEYKVLLPSSSFMGPEESRNQMIIIEFRMLHDNLKQCCGFRSGSGYGRIRILTEKTDPGSIKSRQNKEDKN